MTRADSVMSEKIPGLAKYPLWARVDVGDTEERKLFGPSLAKKTQWTKVRAWPKVNNHMLEVPPHLLQQFLDSVCKVQ